jgi:hypothetical protein
MRKYSVRNQGVELSLCVPQGNVRQLSEIEAEAIHSTLHVVQPKQSMSSKRWLKKPGTSHKLTSKIYETTVSNVIGLIRTSNLDLDPHDSVSDPYQDPVFHFDLDPDYAFHFFSNPAPLPTF